jgi:L-malate glycosyltransferase
MNIKKKIKIAFVIDKIDYYPGGTEKQLLNSIEKLDRNMFDLSLICLLPSPYFDKAPPACDRFVLNYSGFLSTKVISVIIRFRNLIHSAKFDILQTYFEDSFFLTVAATRFEKKPPVLICCRRDIGLTTKEPWYHFLYRLLRPLVYYFFDGIIANSEAVKRHLIQNEAVSEKKILVISNGVDSKIIRNKPPAVFREKRCSYWIGVLANLNPVKRIDIFLKSLALLRDKFKINDFCALVMGEGPERERLNKIALELKLEAYVHFVGSIKNVYEYLQYLDVGVLCSDKEGLSNSILEYMACGLPVIASAVGGNCELVGEQNGIRIPAGDPFALASALARLSRDRNLRTQLGKNSIKIVKEKYSWKESVMKYQEYYKSLIIY